MRDGKIRVKKESVADLKEVAPELYNRMRARGIKTTITLTQDRVEAFVYEHDDGLLELVAGPTRIFDEWINQKNGGLK